MDFKSNLSGGWNGPTPQMLHTNMGALRTHFPSTSSFGQIIRFYLAASGYIQEDLALKGFSTLGNLMSCHSSLPPE